MIDEKAKINGQVGQFPQWISVKDKLPKSGQHILINIHESAYSDKKMGNRGPVNFVTAAIFDVYSDLRSPGRWWEILEPEEDFIYGGVIHNERSEEIYGKVSVITHWMPLPAPPEVPHG